MLERNLLTGEAEAALEDQGGVYALVGPTGVGKTTTTAKIAAAFATKYGAANLGLITLDAYRIGAHEQLRAYGRILGVPVHTAHDRASLEDLLDLLTAKKMVLIDTAGMAQRDARTRELLDMLAHRSIRKLLVVNAAAQGETIEDVMIAYRAASCAGVVLSKMDEAVKLGPALDALIRHQAQGDRRRQRPARARRLAPPVGQRAGAPRAARRRQQRLHARCERRQPDLHRASRSADAARACAARLTPPNPRSPTRMSRLPPLDQAHGLRRLFAHARARFVPVVSNPHVAFGGVMLERLCAGFAEHGVHTLVVDASERAAQPAEEALLDLAACIEPLSAQMSYLAARGLPLRYVDATGSTAPFLRAVAEAAPSSHVVLVHAPAIELCRLFARRRGTADDEPVCPLLLADDRPSSVTHAYAAMKLLATRAGLLVHELVLGASAHSPRAERIAMQIALCADEFLGAVLRDWLLIDPAAGPAQAVTPGLRRWVSHRLQRQRSAGSPTPTRSTFPARATSGTRFTASNQAFH